MQVEGETAQKWSAVRLDSLQSVEGSGRLIKADDQTGEVHWADRTGAACSVTLGGHAIRLVVRR